MIWPTGYPSHQRKLTRAQAYEILTLDGTVPQKSLAERYWVSQAVISALTCGKTYFEVFRQFHADRGDYANAS